MPITTISSYVPTMRDFRLHWTGANAALGESPLLLPGDYSLANFTSDETAVGDVLSAVTQAASQARTSAAQLALLKVPMRGRITQFRLAVQLNLSATRFAKRAPASPGSSDAESSYSSALDLIADVWSQINAATDLAPFVPPLTLQGGYSLADFTTEVAALRAAFAADGSTVRAVETARANRNALLTPAYERMKQYRTAVKLALPANSPLLQTVPRLSPPPGTTPTPVVVTGAWDAQIGKARLTWPVSTAKDLQKLQVRGCTGSYKNDEEETIEDLAADATHWEGDWGLTVPGAIASFKVYVMTSTGNENGGKAVKVVRPEV